MPIWQIGHTRAKTLSLRANEPNVDALQTYYPANWSCFADSALEAGLRIALTISAIAHVMLWVFMAWPGAELSFMDPEVAANVLDARSGNPTRVAELTRDTGPYAAAAMMSIDEIIDPADTRHLLAELVAGETRRPPIPHEQRPIASWPTGW